MEVEYPPFPLYACLFLTLFLFERLKFRREEEVVESLEESGLEEGGTDEDEGGTDEDEDGE